MVFTGPFSQVDQATAFTAEGAKSVLCIPDNSFFAGGAVYGTCAGLAHGVLIEQIGAGYYAAPLAADKDVLSLHCYPE